MEAVVPPPTSPAIEPVASSGQISIFDVQLSVFKSFQNVLKETMVEGGATTQDSKRPASTSKSVIDRKARELPEVLARIQDLIIAKEREVEDERLMKASCNEDTLFFAAASAFALSLPSVISPTQIQAVAHEVTLRTVEALKTVLQLPAGSTGFIASDRHHAENKVVSVALEKIGLSREDFTALAAKQPILYTTHNSHFDFWPKSQTAYLGEFLDLEMFTTDLSAQLGKSATPFLLMTSSKAISSAEQLEKLVALCGAKNIWLHVICDMSIAQLVLDKPPALLQSIVSAASSFSFLPSAQLYDLPVHSVAAVFFQEKTKVTVMMDQQHPHHSHHSLPLVLPLLLLMQRKGRDSLVQSIHATTLLYTQMQKALSEIPSLHYLPSSAQNTLNASLTISFRYFPTALFPDPMNQDVEFVNRINKQFLLDLGELAAQLGIDCILDKSVRPAALFCHFHPLSILSHVSTLSSSDISALSDAVSRFTQKFRFMASLIDSTLNYRADFEREVSRHDSLILTRVNNFLGLGAVRYFPAYLHHTPLNSIAAEVKKELDSVNQTLVMQLREKGLTVCNSSVDADGLQCVSVGIEIAEMSAQRAIEYAQTIAKLADALKLSSKMADNLSPMVRQAMVDAEAAVLRDLNQQKGIARRIPVVGSLVNWWSPPAKVGGRSFDLTSKSIATLASDPQVRKSTSTSDLTNAGGSPHGSPASGRKSPIPSSSNTSSPNPAPAAPSSSSSASASASSSSQQQQPQH